MHCPTWIRRCAVVALALCSACARSADSDGEPALEQSLDARADAPAFTATYESRDSIIFEQRVAAARAQRLDTLDIGATIAALGRTFVGAPYRPGTLELAGPERLIVNLRELDCVTFVESMLALARVLHAGTPTFDAFKRELVRIRYRDGRLDGYSSRLHYFSEWLANNTEKGIVREISAELGGVPDTGDISFMSKHPAAYRQISEPGIAEQIAAMEQRLSRHERVYIPQTRIAQVERDIRDGDIIAATSTLEGLDVAHTGIALWVNQRLHLMHAPLVGSFVEISEVPLADRIQRINAQDGIMVARPQSLH